MPKMKTHRGAARRFKVTGTGKFTRRKGNISHSKTRMSKAANAARRRDVRRQQAGAAHARKLMPYAKR